MTAIAALLFAFSAVMKLMKPVPVIDGFTKLGLPERLMLPLGFLELSCTIVYLIPSTSVLGAILLTGYLGGVILTHLRVGEPVFIPVIVGVLVWGGIFLRDSRLQALVPFRREASTPPANN